MEKTTLDSTVDALKSTETPASTPRHSIPCHSPEGPFAGIYGSSIHTLVDLLAERCQTYRDATAFYHLGQAMTYAELDKKSTTLASALQHRLQIKPGDRVAIMMPNVLQYPVILFAILKVGAVVVNINPLYTVTELVRQLKDAEVTALVSLVQFGAKIADARQSVSISQVILSEVGDCLSPIKGWLINQYLRYIKRNIPSYDLLDAIALKTLFDVGEQQPYQPVAIQPDDLAFLQYTGGTTGEPKGAMLSHHNILANVRQCVDWVKSVMCSGEETIVASLPLYHVFSLTVCCFCFLALGARALLITNPRDINLFVKILKKERFTVFVGLNSLFVALMENSKFSAVDFSPLKLTIAGGMATLKPVSDQWQALTGVPIIEGYGLTETSPVVTINPVDNGHFTGSVGLPLQDTEIEIRDPEQCALPTGEVGEIWIRGPQVMQGYWRSPEETAKAIDAAGWLRTGDLGQQDQDGYLYIVDRVKDMILVSGFNVYPHEVEAVIAQHPAVKEVAVVGIPDEKSGEAVKAYIVKRSNHENPDNQSLTANSIIAYCHRELTGYKIPHHIEFVDELPKTSVGKVSRHRLRQS